MLSNSGWLRAALLAGFAAVVGASSASADPVLGPVTCTLLNPGPGASTTCTFTAAAPTTAGVYALWVQNGDDDTPRLNDATVQVSQAGGISVTPVTSAGLALGQEILFREVHFLSSGTITVTVQIFWDPQDHVGQYLGLTILPLGKPLTTSVGRLLLPYVTSTDFVELDLKNGSHQEPRNFVAVFYNADGSFNAIYPTTGTATLAERASEALTLTDMGVTSTWTTGSIEVFFAGAGRGRLWGQAVESEAGSSQVIVKLDEAGSRLIDPIDPARRSE